MTCLRHGGICKHEFAANLLPSPSVKNIENWLILGEAHMIKLMLLSPRSFLAYSVVYLWSQLLVDPSGHELQLQPFKGLFSRTTWVSRYQKGKTNLDFTGARDSEWQWHQLGHMQVCTSLQTDNHASTPPLCFFQAGCPSCRPNNSVKALKVKRAQHSTTTQTSVTEVSSLVTRPTWSAIRPQQYGLNDAV